MNLLQNRPAIIEEAHPQIKPTSLREIKNYMPVNMHMHLSAGPHVNIHATAVINMFNNRDFRLEAPGNK